ncbi:hypothetical protein PCASD_18338 [Puccinia coronata f. sp. avenae]|uniref:Uncharacterized protein n=1 Tax=Puccinia coronata f. sp. avenae TaxID=200324 RepID=A0A2N5TS04_9BASI|nr:hypothetical protein PCASD_18338 [Puccinia coronata f. sp. avenae]
MSKGQLSSSNRSSASNPYTATAASLSPISKLLGNRPTAVQSLVSKVEAISFEAIPHHEQHQITLQDSTSQSRPSSFQSPSPQGSPPISLTASPNLNEINPHVEELVRETPTIRHLKTSLRSRLQSDSDRHQKRFSEESARSDSTDHHHHHPTPNSSPYKLKPTTSLKDVDLAQSPHPSHIKSVPSSTSTNQITASPQLSRQLTSSDRSSSNPAHNHAGSLSNSLLSKSHQDTRVTSQTGISFRQEDCPVRFATHSVRIETPNIQHPHYTAPSEPIAHLPELRIPLINYHLSPPTLALRSLEVYQSNEQTELADIIAHLIMLPLQTALAITKKLPVLGKHLDLSPPFYQADKDDQGILRTASQIAIGLTLAVKNTRRCAEKYIYVRCPSSYR